MTGQVLNDVPVFLEFIYRANMKKLCPTPLRLWVFLHGTSYDFLWPVKETANNKSLWGSKVFWANEENDVEANSLTDRTTTRLTWTWSSRASKRAPIQGQWNKEEPFPPDFLSRCISKWNIFPPAAHMSHLSKLSFFSNDQPLSRGPWVKVESPKTCWNINSTSMITGWSGISINLSIWSLFLSQIHIRIVSRSWSSWGQRGMEFTWEQ